MKEPKFKVGDRVCFVDNSGLFNYSKVLNVDVPNKHNKHNHPIMYEVRIHGNDISSDTNVIGENEMLLVTDDLFNKLKAERRHQIKPV